MSAVTSNNDIYQKTVKLTENYLGPAGERFIDRQISTHLEIDPENLDEKNLSKLIDWLVIAFALLTNDRDDVKSFKSELLDLAKNNK